MKLKNITILLSIISVAVILRFYQLDKIPPGLNIDEASEGYNAFSILHTGKDRYGQSFPILFRSFGSFQAPLYTYFSIIPISLLGNSIFAIHLLAALSGILLVIITIILLVDFINKGNIKLAVIAALLVSISPWAVFFSRFATEAILGVMLFALSFLLCYLSLRIIWLFPLATFILGLSTHAYYSERLISILFLSGFILIFRKMLFSKKKLLVCGLIVFILTQIPYLTVLSTGAFTRRFTQIDYVSEQFFQNNSGSFRNMPMGRILFVAREFLSHYIAYFSPMNLFFNQDPQGSRSMPDLSVFYSWMIVPFVFGLRFLLINRKLPLVKMLVLIILAAPIPASLTRDPFSTIRTLTFFWSITLVISFGIYHLLDARSKFLLRFSILTAIIIFSLIQLYISYFVLLKYERAENYGYSYLELLKTINHMKNNKFVIDSARDLAIGIRYAYLEKYDPLALQKILGGQINNQYYNTFEFDEPYAMDNLEVRPIVWQKDIYQDQILVGDLLAISDNQAKEHYLKFFFDIKNMAGDIVLKAYKTDPKINCVNLRRLQKDADLKDCQKYF